MQVLPRIPGGNIVNALEVFEDNTPAEGAAERFAEYQKLSQQKVSSYRDEVAARCKEIRDK